MGLFAGCIAHRGFAKIQPEGEGAAAADALALGGQRRPMHLRQAA